MRKADVQIGRTNIAKVSGKLVPVRIDSVHSVRGWHGTNTKTGRRVHIRSAQRLRCPFTRETLGQVVLDSLLG